MRLMLPVLLILSGAALTWLAGTLTYDRSLNYQVEVGRQRLHLYSSTIANALDRFRILPFVVADDKRVRRMLAAPFDQTLQDEVNSWLEKVNSAAGSSHLYVMNLDGLTVAASNSAEDTSFVGHNYAFRPYFLQSLEKGEGEWFAIGLTTRLPGYFMARAVREGGRVVGVAAVKVDLEPLQAEWGAGGETVFVTDANGVVVLTSVPQWKYRVFGELSDESRKMLDATKQYDGVAFAALDVAQIENIHAAARLVWMKPQGRVIRNLVQDEPFPVQGWTIHYMTGFQTVSNNTYVAVLAAALFAFALSAAILYLRQRSAHARSVRQARDRLESTVQERTADLQAEIAERRRAEQELRDAQEELVQAGKMAALGRMSAAIAHEVNQPLAALQTFVASSRIMLERGMAEKLAENLDHIGDLGKRMASITGQLKDFARKRPDAGRSVELRQSLDRALLILDGRIRADHVALHVDVAHGARVRGDSVRLEQVFVNLLSNGLDAVKNRTDPALRIALSSEGGDWVMRFADNGPGIDPAQAAQVFDPFFTTKDPGEGLGLGLFISYGIIQDFGGAVRVGAAAEGGAEFVLVLPVWTDEAKDAS